MPSSQKPPKKWDDLDNLVYLSGGHPHNQARAHAKDKIRDKTSKSKTKDKTKHRHSSGADSGVGYRGGVNYTDGANPAGHSAKPKKDVKKKPSLKDLSPKSKSKKLKKGKDGEADNDDDVIDGVDYSGQNRTKPDTTFPNTPFLSTPFPSTPFPSTPFPSTPFPSTPFPSTPFPLDSTTPPFPPPELPPPPLIDTHPARVYTGPTLAVADYSTVKISDVPRDYYSGGEYSGHEYEDVAEDDGLEYTSAAAGGDAVPADTSAGGLGYSGFGPGADYAGMDSDMWRRQRKGGVR